MNKMFLETIKRLPVKLTSTLLLASTVILLPMVFIISSATAGTVDRIESSAGDIMIHPVTHASIVITTKNKSIFVDPVGEASLYKSFPKPDLILLTDIHGDHLNPATIQAVKTDMTLIVGPKAVADKLTGVTVIQNGDRSIRAGIVLEAVPMYNITKERKKFHPMGRGNGYIMTLNSKRIYISGDTEDIPEMKNLKNIDAAFVCMNLPYTMDETRAASAVLAFKPGIVYPYHFRGKKEGQPFFHDVKKFKSIVDANKAIDVRLLNWY